MKTTVEISDALAKAARSLASKEGLTLRDLIEDGLRRVLEARARRAKFRLRPASFAGRGLQAGFREGSWEKIREAAYEGRGG